jgi:hypothetical protein
VLAYKQLPGEAGPAELRHMPRAEAESGLTFAGFAVLACPLKPGSHCLHSLQLRHQAFAELVQPLRMLATLVPKP